MNLVLKVIRKVLRIPFRLIEEFELRLKKEGCIIGEGARLYPSSRVENNQGRPSAIVIAARSQVLGHLVVMGHGGSIRIGSSCFIGEQTRIWSADSIVIGNRVLISHNVNIHDHNSHSWSAQRRHMHFNQIFSAGHPKELKDVPSSPIIIEDDAWIGFNATILKGVKIGTGAIVGAASVVTKDVAPYTVVAGNPAKVMREIPVEDR
ncbi:acetyltransferase-like isoleucine patch superfamily enzyme [Granulicella aggregans]|uniref:Acetyltransferase-like isoleucine patch superfamily enzyme n=1 Tax=Granulicella aggregans TaxID=474949 RepID=A0A7W7ZCB9_9BACT|nr:acyltransferase [Granulicella aggregans]MBB5057285.1 acetyltransferase-like isoleucine patch superfamily enzyme [Granulicella aggregans]